MPDPTEALWAELDRARRRYREALHGYVWASIVGGVREEVAHAAFLAAEAEIKRLRRALAQTETPT